MSEAPAFYTTFSDADIQAFTLGLKSGRRELGL